ncbi:MAG: hypothetical protein KGL71_06400, partial [Xanthomonadaceae bacterium]|nr:hypothetical protein [Xanthomonadaceae bacterium]
TRPIGSNAPTISYFHTDALGSPIAKTNAAGAIIETSEYEPYGRLLNRANDNRAGYTGHVMDAASGLTYMQQRYYDPTIGRFLSVDPVTANSVNGSNFNRYWYAAGNPYKFTDPDGRDVTCSENRCTMRSHTRLEWIVDRGTVAIIYARRLLENAIVNAQQNEGAEQSPTQNEPGESEGNSGEGDGGRIKTPNSGEPGSVYVNPNSGQERLYGEDGLPEVDVDHHPDHGQGTPHDHHWTRGPDGRPIRGPARPAPPRDPPKPKEPPEKPNEKSLM